MTGPNDLLVTSPDLNEERLETLKQLFPDLFTSEGKLNPAELKRLLEDEATTDKEQYAFTWKGKGKAKKHAFTPSRAALTYDPERSVNPDKANGNMIIEGENLEVLKLLTSAYREQVKCIYIDPPYNTGGDFIYPDNYTKSRKEYWEENGAYKDGVKLDTNTEASGRYHSDWLSMMYSRLLVARQLLKDDGLIFASIDDNEVHNLRKLMDEVFGEENFVIQIVWERAFAPKNDSKHFSNNHDYLLVYGRSIEYTRIKRLLRTAKADSRYKNLDNDPRGPWLSDNITAKTYSAKLDYPIVTPGGRTVSPARGRSWTISKEKFSQLVAENRIWFGNEGNNVPRLKRFLSDMTDGMVPISIWKHNEVGHNQEGRQELKEIFDNEGVFDSPKPVRLMVRLLQIATDDADLIIDFFAGSGSMAHAVMKLNQEDGGNRQFILVQLPEAIAKGHSAYKAGYRTISQITIERCKRVIQGYGKNPQPLGTGFKVYRLTKSHFPRAEFQPDPDKSSEENVELLKKYITEKEASFQMAFEQDDVFDEVLLKHGFKLDYKLTKQEGFSKNAVYLAEKGDHKAYICLDTNIAEETIDYFKSRTNTMFICLERALDTTKKWNLNHSLGERLKAI